jgi:Ser/Thr protein kinase RdoA (MazF antagonist)
MNDTYLVSTSFGRYFLRVSRHGWRTESQLQSELKFVRGLDQKGVSVAQPIASKSGSWVVPLAAPEGLRYCTLFTAVEGREFRKTEADSFLYGQAVAAFHDASSGFKPDGARPLLDSRYLVYEPMEAILAQLRDRDAEFNYMAGLVSRLRDRIEAAATAGIEFGFCHGDLWGGNAHLCGKMVFFFDFDCCGFGWRAYDIATFRWWHLRDGRGERLWRAFQAGYCSRRHLEELDRNAVPLFVVARALWHQGLHEVNADDWGARWINRQERSACLKRLRKIEEMCLASVTACFSGRSTRKGSRRGSST